MPYYVAFVKYCMVRIVKYCIVIYVIGMYCIVTCRTEMDRKL